MKSKYTYLVVTFLSLVLLSACSTLPQTVSSPTSSNTVSTPYPTKSPKTTTAVPTLPPGAPLTSLTTIHMLDAQDGWAWATPGRLLRTADGGKTWVDRTPEGYQYIDSGFFLDAQTAWLPVYLTDSGRFGLLHTRDGGESWVQYPQGPASGLHFTDSLNGWAVAGDVGAGNVYFSLSQTSDGGKTWAPIPVKPQESEPGLSAGTIHLCNICNDALYYDPGRLIIILGDLGSMQPTGSVRLEVSFDLGKTWQAHNLPLPQGETDALVAPNQPVFFDDRDGLLPVHLLKMNPDSTYGEQKMVVYATSDGGASWSLLPTVLDAIPLFETIQTDSSQDVFIICGSALCASHDKARTWQKVTSDLDFTTTDTRSISAMDFVNSNAGWALVLENETTSLYMTSDGGIQWALANPLLVPSTPSTVTVDTSIPTPTPVPTATLEPTPTPNVVFDQQANADRVTFAPYATWVEFSSSLTANKAKRFVLSALQYQTMSVSVRQGPAYTVVVTGADKNTLTDANNPQFYWRGVLPSTQDYYVTVTSQVEGPFTLRITINPQGLPYQYLEFYDSLNSVALSYSDEFAPLSWQLPFTTKGTPLVTLYYIEPSFYYPTTKLIEAGMELTATSDPGIVSSCTIPLAQSGETVSGQVTVNGYTFTRSEFTGAAAGNRYDQVFYRTVYQDKCFEVIFLIHSSDIANYPPGSVVEFDMERLLHKFEEVLGTFVAK